MNISLRPEDQKFIQQQLDKGQFRSADDIIHTALQLLEQHKQSQTPATETCYDLLQQAGVIGMIKDGPNDVSSNPKHMQGFGET